jgi:hypothetical protein
MGLPPTGTPSWHFGLRLNGDDFTTLNLPAEYVNHALKTSRNVTIYSARKLYVNKPKGENAKIYDEKNW